MGQNPPRSLFCTLSESDFSLADETGSDWLPFGIYEDLQTLPAQLGTLIRAGFSSDCEGRSRLKDTVRAGARPKQLLKMRVETVRNLPLPEHLRPPGGGAVSRWRPSGAQSVFQIHPGPAPSERCTATGRGEAAVVGQALGRGAHPR